MSFAHALQRFQQGDITRQELDSEVDRVLAGSPANLPDLAAEMERALHELQIAPEVVDAIRARIAANTGYPHSAPVDDKTRLTSGNLSAPPRSDFSPSEMQGFQQSHVGQRELVIGDVLGGRFRLEQLLGKGGMSQVFLAEDLAAYGNPRVAVKVLSDAFSAHPDALVSLKRETAKAQQLAHPNIINVRDFGVDGPHIYMHMEYLDGGSLYDELQSNFGQGLPTDDATSVLKGVCEALDYAHKHKIVHADLKPGNFMLTRSVGDNTVQAKIIDFGISRPARALGAVDDQATIYDPGNLRALTVAYASPEMQEGKDPDPRDDIYALGCIAYEIFTGNHPFDRISALQAKSRNLDVENHRALNKRQLKAIRHAVAFDRESRTASAGEFLRDFQSADSPAITVPWKSIGVAAAAIAATVAIVALIVSLDPFGVNLNAPGRTFQDCAECPAMTVIAAGTFKKGSPPDRANSFANERPAHPVTLAQPFALSTNEITVAEFRRFAEDQGYATPECLGYGRNGWSSGRGNSWKNPGFEQADNHPVTCVSWQDASNYAEWLGKQTGFVYRLPSASEWEYAAAAGSTSAAWWAERQQTLCSVANIADQSARNIYPAWSISTCSDATVNTAPVGSFAANPFGINDTLGNVFEWVLDCWNADYVGAPADGSAWLQGDCSQRELRGGSWFTQPELVTQAFRNRLAANTRTSSIGFRIVRELERTDE